MARLVTTHQVNWADPVVLLQHHVVYLLPALTRLAWRPGISPGARTVLPRLVIASTMVTIHFGPAALERLLATHQLALIVPGLLLRET